MPTNGDEFISLCHSFDLDSTCNLQSSQDKCQFKCPKEKQKSSAWGKTQKNVLMLFWEESFTCQLLCKHGYSTSRISLAWAEIHTEHCVSIYLTYVTKGNKSKQEVEPGQFYQKNIPCVDLILAVNKKCVCILYSVKHLIIEFDLIVFNELGNFSNKIL